VNVLRSLRNRLLAGLFLLLLLFLALVFAGIGSLRAVNRAVESELTTLATSSDLATDLVGSAADQVRAGESYLNQPSPEVALEFLRLGGIVGFVRDGTRVRFDVNIAAARRVGLAISSRLLRIARRVSSAVPEQ